MALDIAPAFEESSPPMPGMSRRWVAVAALVTTGVIPPAFAQEAPTGGDSEPAATAPSPPPDVVVTKAGAMVRGTISEMDPQGEVAIQTMSGEMRRFSMSEVEYAGPAANMPKKAAPEAAPTAPAPKKKKAKKRAEAPTIRVRAGEADVRLVANPSEVTFHLKTGSANWQGTGSTWSSSGGPGAVAVSGTSSAYSIICEAPCDAVLPTGSHRMALSLGDGAPVEADGPVRLRGPSKLQGKYTSNKAIRIAGAVIALGGLGVGTVLVLTNDYDSDSSQATVGLGVLLVGALVGTVMLFIPDYAEIEVTPDRSSRRERRSAVRLSPSGLLF